jgi:hypothetical protein
MNETKNKKRISSYLPWISLIILTIALMVIFKLTDQGYDKLQTHGGNLLAEYTKGLRPLYSKTEITNEDVFNFALYDKIPLDKQKKKILNLKSDSYGIEKIQVVNTDSDFNTNNYNSFKQKLELNSDEEATIDSVLETYKNNIYATVLQSDDNNVVAVAPKLSLLHKALSADIYSFAIDKVNKSDGNKTIFTSKPTIIKKFSDDVNKKQAEAPEEYFILTPDTAFSSKAFASKDADEKKIRFAEKINPNVKVLPEVGSPVVINDFDSFYELNPIPESEFYYSSDSSLKKLIIPSSLFSSSFDLAYDSLQNKLDLLTNEFNKINMKFDSNENGFNFSLRKRNEDFVDEVNLEFDFGNLSSFITNTLEIALASESEKDWEKFAQKMDSLSQAVSDFENDSAAIIKLKMLSKELKKRKQDEVTNQKKSSQKNNN